MKAWYFPSRHGDLRLEPIENDLSRTRLTIVQPTPHEQQLLQAMETIFRKRGWWTSPEALYKPSKRAWLRKSQAVVTCELGGPFSEIGAIVAGHMKPGPATLTAVRFESGKVFTVVSGEGELSEAMSAAMALGSALEAPPPPPPALPAAPFREPADPAAHAQLLALVDKPDVPAAPPPPEPPKPVDKAVVAASVQRPTPCCPQCIPGAVEPASEVLLSFLDDEQHESWAKDRCIKVVGGYTGVEYLLAHRHTKRAQKIGRICWSITDECVVHFHGNEVPPEEEVLTAKLILEHREDWLRNEATLFGRSPVAGRFKNPFGDLMDGTADAGFMEDFGALLLGGWRSQKKRKTVSSTFYVPNPASGLS